MKRYFKLRYLILLVLVTPILYAAGYVLTLFFENLGRKEFAPPPEPIATFERLAPTEGHPKGRYRIQMEDILFDISFNKHLMLGLGNHFDMGVCWLSEQSKLIDSDGYDCRSNNGHGAHLQFRANRIPSRGYWNSLIKDNATKLIYRSPSDYVLRPSPEFPDLQEFYLLNYHYSFQFLLDYKDADSGRMVAQRIGCFPDFRENEKIISASKGMGNVECHYGFFLSPHVHIVVKFSSRIMPQFKSFEKQIHEFVNRLMIGRQE